MEEKVINEIIENYVDSNYFDTETLKDYISRHEKVDGNVFLFTKKVQLIENVPTTKNPYENWFFESENSFETIDRDTFIRRIPFYFYHPKNEGIGTTRHGCLQELILQYQSFENETNEFMPMVDRKNEYYPSVEPLYKILEDLFYCYHISLEDIFEYVHRQCNRCIFWVFYTWYKYVKLASKLGLKSMTPANILWSYNVALEKDGQKPIIYKPQLSMGYNDLIERHNGYVLMAGYFPINPNNGQVNKKWIGVWIEEESYIIPTNYLRAGEKASSIGNPLEVTIKIGITKKTIICVSDDKTNKENEYYLTSGLHTWESIYVGTAAMQFDMDRIKLKRKEIGYTQGEVAALLDISTRTYQNWEMKISTPDANNLIRLLNILNITDVQEIIKKDSINDDKLDKFLSGRPFSYFAKKCN